MTFYQKLQNFWYYHKMHMAVALVFVLAIAVASYSCARKPQVDMYVLYVSTGAINQNAVKELSEKLETYAQDITGDGKKHVQMITVTFSEVLARQSQDTVLAQYVTGVASGTALFYVFDDVNFAELATQNVLLPLDASENTRYNATSSGFLDDIDWYKNATKPYYFGLRITDGIKEDDARYPQISQAAQTLAAIMKDYPVKGEAR